jgi:hypothetical protein
MKESDILEDLGIAGRIALRFISGKWNWRVLIRLIWLGIGTISSSIKARNFLTSFLASRKILSYTVCTKQNIHNINCSFQVFKAKFPT